jgi:hypothetical protein
VVVHFRSGDVFRGSGGVHPNYRQPPLAYYVNALDGALNMLSAEQRLAVGVTIAFEDNLNPVIDEFISDCRSRDLPVTVSTSRSFIDDLAVLMTAHHLIASNSTLTRSVCLLSKHMQAISIFDQPNAVDIARSLNITCWHFIDQAGQYIQPAEWKNTPQQRKMMLEYPGANLAVQQTGSVRKSGGISTDLPQTLPQ